MNVWKFKGKVQNFGEVCDCVWKTCCALHDVLNFTAGTSNLLLYDTSVKGVGQILKWKMGIYQLTSKEMKMWRTM